MQKKISISETADNISGDGLSESDFNKLIRGSLTDFHASIREEKLFPYQIEFQVSAEESAKELFEHLSEIIIQNNRVVTYINFGRTGRSDDGPGFVVKLSCEPVSFFPGFDLSFLSDFFECFHYKIINSKSVSNQLVRTNTNSKPEISVEEKQERLLKIGEIQNGSQIVVFYKNAEGKMEKRIQFRGNEL